MSLTAEKVCPNEAPWPTSCTQLPPSAFWNASATSKVAVVEEGRLARPPPHVLAPERHEADGRHRRRTSAERRGPGAPCAAGRVSSFHAYLPRCGAPAATR